MTLDDFSERHIYGASVIMSSFIGRAWYSGLYIVSFSEDAGQGRVGMIKNTTANFIYTSVPK